MTLFDSHAHYTDGAFGSEEERDALITRLSEQGVKYILNAGTNPVSSLQGLALADRHPGLFASVGIHPGDLEELSDPETAFRQIKELAKREKAVAIGEIGLDYHYRTDNKEKQAYWFSRQLELAGELGLPVIIHDREAHGDCLKTVFSFPEVKGVFHSFSGSRETAAELLRKGWYLSFSGVITFKNAPRLAEVVPTVPDDRLLIETDCPYLTPHPFRGKRNDSGYLFYTAEKAAELRGCDAETVARLTLANAARLFSKTGIVV